MVTGSAVHIHVISNFYGVLFIGYDESCLVRSIYGEKVNVNQQIKKNVYIDVC